jgi:hypothetical protein
VIDREPVRPFEPGTIGRLVEDEVADTLEMAEDLAGWAGARALDANQERRVQRESGPAKHEGLGPRAA